ncbi:MAG: hypothetical protein Q9184_005997 [Pyrenodesmia sp. 2 TL-2023]
MGPKKKGRPAWRAVSSPAGNSKEDVSMAEDTQSKEIIGRLSFQDNPWTDEQEAALFKGLVRWKPESLSYQAGSPDSEGNHRVYNQFALPKEDYGKAIDERKFAKEPSPASSESALPPSAGSTSAAATRRASTVDDTEDPGSSPASARETRATRTIRGTRTTRRSQLNEVSSVQDRGGNSKGTLEGSSVTGQDEQRIEGTEEPEEEEDGGQEETTKPSATKASRRRSTRRR